jgi:hypothetical protein
LPCIVEYNLTARNVCLTHRSYPLARPALSSSGGQGGASQGAARGGRRGAACCAARDGRLGVGAARDGWLGVGAARGGRDRAARRAACGGRRGAALAPAASWPPPVYLVDVVFWKLEPLRLVATAAGGPRCDGGILSGEGAGRPRLYAATPHEPGVAVFHAIAFGTGQPFIQHLLSTGSSTPRGALFVCCVWITMASSPSRPWPPPQRLWRPPPLGVGG